MTMTTTMIMVMIAGTWWGHGGDMVMMMGEILTYLRYIFKLMGHWILCR